MNQQEIEDWESIDGWRESCTLVDTVVTRKQQLLTMAKNGENRPTESHPLGPFLIRNTSYRKGYDIAFNEKIRMLRPDWFLGASNRTTNNKKQLTEMAKNGEDKPLRGKSDLGGVLRMYTIKNSGCYDANFDVEIRRIAPHWFDKVSSKKQQLLTMAKNGNEKPFKNHELYFVFYDYTDPNRSSYDDNFYKQIKKLRPDWFKYERK